MNTTRLCGCKGHRSCLVCEKEYGIKSVFNYDNLPTKYYQINGDNGELEKLGFSGINIITDFISEEEERKLIEDIDLIPWDKSQSGRRKQNFGPKANFKKRKTKVGDFKGFPKSTQFIQERFSTVPLLESYRTVEQCSIEYTPDTGACIEPHIDDCWIWGERIVQLNLLSSTYLSLIPYRGDKTKYNLQDVETYPRIIENNKVVCDPFKEPTNSESETSKVQPYPLQNGGNENTNVIVKLLLPPRSLLVMYGSARYDWEHFILREDISTRRVIIAYREFTPTYLPGGEKEEIGEEILKEAENFFNDPGENISLPVKKLII